MGLKFSVLGGFKGENMKDECWDPPRKSIPTETRHPVQKMRWYSQKCVLQRKVKKEKRKEKISQLNIIFHPFAPPTPLGRFVPFLARRVRPRTLSSKSNFKSIDSGVWELRVPKIWGFPLTLIVAFTTVLRITVFHCDNSWGKIFEALEDVHPNQNRSYFSGTEPLCKILSKLNKNCSYTYRQTNRHRWF